MIVPVGVTCPFSRKEPSKRPAFVSFCTVFWSFRPTLQKCNISDSLLSGTIAHVFRLIGTLSRSFRTGSTGMSFRVAIALRSSPGKLTAPIVGHHLRPFSEADTFIRIGSLDPVAWTRCVASTNSFAPFSERAQLLSGLMVCTAICPRREIPAVVT